MYSFRAVIEIEELSINRVTKSGLKSENQITFTFRIKKYEERLYVFAFGIECQAARQRVWGNMHRDLE